MPVLYIDERSIGKRSASLVDVPATQLRQLHGAGPRVVRLLPEALEQHGMSLS
jgi:hypothetical protein